MYSIRPNLIIGFHGCEKEVAIKVINGEEDLKFSTNPYDWLGNGMYFWENDYQRALEYAEELRFKEPFVLGGILNLGHCLDLASRKGVNILKHSYDNLLKESMKTSITNKKGKRGGINGDLLLRFLDCAVIEALHEFNEISEIQQYDSVKAAFWEGKELYPTAGFREKNHIQICIRNPKCILGYFLPSNI